MEACLKALPLLIINLSGEMLYILDQRLRAQNVAVDKANRVREDLAIKLVEKSFLENLFMPQKLYTYDECKKTFQDIVHSSIMKLNAASMSKLYDLMLMGVKMQTLCIKYPEELLHVTLNHLEHMIDLVRGSDAEQKLRALLLARIVGTYSVYKPYQFAQIRRTLLDFFIDKNIRVSLFLAEKVQLEDGTFYIDLTEEMPPGIAELPRTILQYNPNGRLERKNCDNPLPIPKLAISTVRDRMQERRTLLGINIYADSRPMLRSDTVVSDSPPPRLDRTNSRQFLVSDEESKKATNWELDILADFTGVSQPVQETVRALHFNDESIQLESEPQVAKVKISSRLTSLKAQFNDFGIEEDKDNRDDFFA
mmetsp:Transcript_13713/g.25858  ORF Transcript_13713/g.25858 Transcript_13713/m.25858 type:complete len:366 (-) Transcript_13713:61-1158(-)